MFLSRQFARFAMVGAVGTTVQFCLLWAGVEILAAPAAVSSAVGYAFGSVVNYLLNYWFTFRSSQSHFQVAARYYAVTAIGWCINFALMGLLVHRMNWNYWFAQGLVTGICLLWNYAGSKAWAFKQASA